MGNLLILPRGARGGIYTRPEPKSDPPETRPVTAVKLLPPCAWCSSKIVPDRFHPGCCGECGAPLPAGTEQESAVTRSGEIGSLVIHITDSALDVRAFMSALRRALR